MSAPSHRSTSTRSSSRSTPEPDFSAATLSTTEHKDAEDLAAEEQLRRNLMEIARDAAVDARNARKGSINEEYMRMLVEEVEVELGIRRG